MIYYDKTKSVASTTSFEFLTYVVALFWLQKDSLCVCFTLQVVQTDKKTNLFRQNLKISYSMAIKMFMDSELRIQFINLQEFDYLIL